MTNYDLFWCSNPDWFYFDHVKGKILKEDAPQEAKESYARYLRQVIEHEERMKEYYKQRSVRN